ncbi:MAG TPA: glycosyltransferase family 4 protein, partial [Trebonia sp.]|nr:glycosyltransferase family 4 protein [Trebonia sp.]
MTGSAPGAPPAVAPAAVVLVVGTTAGGTGAHVRMLAAGLAGRGVDVLVCGPARTGAGLGLASVPGVRLRAVEFGNRPRPGDVAALRALRCLLPGSGDTVAHAHGLRAGALTVLALAFTRRPRPRLVVTVHNAPPAGGFAARVIYRALERVVARGAGLV